jgi:hypothetical protein
MIACKATQFIHIPSAMNCADVNTKPLVATLHHGVTGPIFSGNGVPHLFTMAHEDIYKKKNETE